MFPRKALSPKLCYKTVLRLPCPNHEANVQDQLPCMSAADCEMFDTCSNRIDMNLTQVRISDMLMRKTPEERDLPTGLVQRGLYVNVDKIRAGTVVASFGPVQVSEPRRTELGYAIQVRRGKEGSWSRNTDFVTPIKGWKDKDYRGPYVNHTCCKRYVNCEYVPTEDYGSDEGARMTTVFVRTTKDVWGYFESGQHKTPKVELLANYGEDYKKIVQNCKCCACRKTHKGCRR